MSDPKPSPFVLSSEALFRYQVVSQVVADVRAGRRLRVVVKDVASRPHLSVDGEYSLRKTTSRSVYRWYAAFNAGGTAALEPAVRARTTTSEVLPDKFIEFLRSEKKADDEASIPELIRRAVQLGLLEPAVSIDRTTVWRAVKRMGLHPARRSNKRDADMRRFAYPNRMMMVLCDGKHFRAGPAKTRRLVLFFIDDATRFIPFVVVGASESTHLFLRGLYELIRRVGLMDILFLDRGAGFRSEDTLAVCARLDVKLIHGTVAYPEGHGKIERFHQTAWQDTLRALTAPGIDDAFAALELRLNHYVATQYNFQPHESLDKDSPSERWHADERPMRFHANDAELRECFVITESRAVSTDNVLRVDGTFYEVPRGHRGTDINIFRQTLDQTVSIIHDGKRVRLHPVDLEANARAHRARTDSEKHEQKESTPPTRTSAQIAFDRDYGPVIASDGGYVPPTKTKE
jgi:putative transposase